jgi:hypothetical protein
MLSHIFTMNKAREEREKIAMRILMRAAKRLIEKRRQEEKEALIELADISNKKL